MNGVMAVPGVQWTREACWSPLSFALALEVEISYFLPSLLCLSLLPSLEAFTWGVEVAPFLTWTPACQR